MNLFKALQQGGGYTLPFLLKLSSPAGQEPAAEPIYLINDNTPLEYGGVTWQPSQFSYTPNDSGEGSLSIELAQTDGIIDLLESYYELNLELVGVYLDNEVHELGSFKHRFGTATWDGKELQIDFEQDDRLTMTFPALIFNSYNNRGNT